MYSLDSAPIHPLSTLKVGGIYPSPQKRADREPFVKRRGRQTGFGRKVVSPPLNVGVPCGQRLSGDVWLRVCAVQGAEEPSGVGG